MTNFSTIGVYSLARVIGPQSFKRMMLCTSAVLWMILTAFLPTAFAQNLPGPLNNPGGQLLYFYEDGTEDAARGEYAARLTVTNTHPSATVCLHFQFYVNWQGGWVELMDFMDFMNPGQRHILDPKGIRRPSDNLLVGFTTNGRFLLTVTPVNPTHWDLRAIAFNWLLGTMEVRHVASSTLWTLNAISRQAVDSDGAPLNETFTETVPSTVFLDGSARLFQKFRPQLLSVNFFFPPANVYQGPPLGNRLILLAFKDEYQNAQNMYKIQPGVVSLNSFLFDNASLAYSVPPRTINGLGDYVIGSSASGNLPDFLGAALDSRVRLTGGWLRMRPSMLPDTSILGWFSQSFGAYGGGDMLIPARVLP